MRELFSCLCFPMNIRETLTRLVDRYGEDVKLSRRQLATEASVNAGQVSNWLRGNGFMSPQREGAVAEVALNHIEDFLARSPDAPNRRALELFRSTLADFPPRIRRIAALPDAAEKGEPISTDNPFYVIRNSDLDLADRLKCEVIRLGVQGGPKTGKSSLLFAAEEALESSRDVLRVDFQSYPATKQADPSTAPRDLCRWIQMKCEDQMSGSFSQSFEGPRQMPQWVTNNVLPNSGYGRSVVLFDNIGALYREEWGQSGGADYVLVRSFQEAVANVVERASVDASLRRFGVVCAYDPFDKAFPKDQSARVFSGLSVVDLVPLQINHVDRLLNARDLINPPSSTLREIHEKSGGHPFVTQVLCEAMSKGQDLDAALARARKVLATAVRSRWSAERIEFAAQAMKSDTPALPINGRGVLDLIHSGLVAEADMDKRGFMTFKPMVQGLTL